MKSNCCQRVFKILVFFGVASLVSYFYQYFLFKKTGIAEDIALSPWPYFIAAALFLIPAFIIKFKKSSEE